MSELSSECFAYPQKKKYPVHTKQAALASFEQFKRDIEDYSIQRIDAITSNFVKAASLHNIKYNMQAQTQPLMNQYQTSDGSFINFTKVASASDIPHVVEFLQKLRNDYPLQELRKVAICLYSDIDGMQGAPQLMQKVANFAGLGFGQPQQMLQQFLKRGSLINMPFEVKSAFYKTYNDFKDADQQTLFKKSSQMCDLLDGIDRLYKLAGYYDTKLKRPQEVCFSQNLDTLIKEAQDYLTVASTGTIMSKSALLQNKDRVKEFFNQYYQIPVNSDAEMLQKVAALSETGIKTLVKELE